MVGIVLRIDSDSAAIHVYLQTAAYQRSISAVRAFYPAAFLFSGGLIDVAGDCIISLATVINSKVSGIQTGLVTGYGSYYGEECVISNTCCCRLEFDLTGVAYDSVVDKTITLYIGIDIACECGQCRVDSSTSLEMGSGPV